MNEIEDSFGNERKFRVRGKWELILVLLVVIAGVVVTTIAVLKAKEKRDSLHLPSESGQSVIDSTPTRLLISGEDGPTSSNDDNIRRGSRQKDSFEKGGEGRNNRRQNHNRYQAEKDFGGGTGNSGDLSGYESAPAGRHVTLKHRRRYGDIVIDDDNNEEEDEGGQLPVSNTKFRVRDLTSSRNSNSGISGSENHYQRMAFLNDGLPGYPGPAGYKPTVYLDETKASNGPPSVEYSAPSAGFLLLASDQSESVYEAETPSDKQRKNHPKMSGSQQHGGVVSGPVVAVMAPPELLPVASARPNYNLVGSYSKGSPTAFEKRQKGSNFQLHSSLMTGSEVVAMPTRNQDIFQVLSSGTVSSGSPNVGVSGVGYENANYLTPNELYWLQQSRPELFGGHLATSESKVVTRSSSLGQGPKKSHHGRFRRSTRSTKSLLEEWTLAEAESRQNRFKNPKSSYIEEETENDDDDYEETIKPNKRQKQIQKKLQMKKAASEKKLAKKLTTATTTTKKPVSLKSKVNDRANRYSTSSKTALESQQKEASQAHPYANILGSGNFEIIRGGIIDKSDEKTGKAFKMKNGESESGAAKVMSRKKDMPPEVGGDGGGGGFTDYGTPGSADEGGGDGEDEEKTTEDNGEGDDAGNEGENSPNAGNTEKTPGDAFEPFNFDFFGSEPLLGFQGYDKFDAGKPEKEKNRY